MAKGAAWNFFHLIVGRGISLITRVILARILLPEHFGVFASIMLFIGLATTIVDLGVQSALIQRQGRQKGAIASSGHWLIVAFGTCIMLSAIFALSPALGGRLIDPDFIAPARILIFGVLIQAFGIIPTALLIRRREFKKLTFTESIGTVAGAALALTLATQGAGIWTLVAQQLVSAMVTMSLQWRASRWLPSLHCNWSVLREISRYCTSITGTKSLTYARSSLDTFVIGVTLGTWQLGIYTMAFSLTELIRSQIGAHISRLTLPLFSRIQSDLGMVRSAYLNGCRTMSIALFPISLIILLHADFITANFLGVNWGEATTPMRILSAGGLVFAAFGPCAEVLQAIGRPELLLRTAFHNTLLLALPSMIILTSKMGLTGAGFAFLLTSIGHRVSIYFSLREIINVRWIDLWFAIRAATYGAVAVCLFTWFFSIHSPIWLTLIASAIIYTLTIILNRGIRRLN